MKNIIKKDDREIIRIYGYLCGQVIADYRKKYQPCRYCFRYDEKVTWIKEGGFMGYYHSFCAAKIINETIMALAIRMK